ncbi:MAG TPA: ammonium transporter [Bryobacteraceae bacterium]|nr:ammonium transporter [Bryobacteraceae bacterium]
MTIPLLSESGVAFVMLSILLIPLAIAGMALINTGLGRSRNAGHLMMSTLCVIGVAAGTYFICGFAWQGVIGGPAHLARLGSKDWNWLAAQPAFLRGVEMNGSPASLTVWMQMLAVALAAMIPMGSAAERWRLGAMCASTALLAGVTYPLFAHWVWGGGWLAQLGVNYGLGHGFVDAGGSATIQAVGGLTALSMAWIMGPRRGKYTSEGMPTAIPGHHAVFVLFGCLMAWVGWLGLNSAGAALFSGMEPRRAVLVAVNTTLSAGAAALMTVMATRVRFGKPDASLTANGWVAGLAASSAGCAFVPPAAAALIGLIAGLVVPFAIENLELRLGIDDPGGSISVHAIGGLWGILALGLFERFPAPVLNTPDGLARLTSLSGVGQGLAQLIGAATLIGFVLPLTYGLNWLLNRFVPQRVAPEGERQGLDLYELGAGAYPEFMTHTDEFYQR